MSSGWEVCPRPLKLLGIALALSASVVLIPVAAASAASETLHEEKSLYRNIVVKQNRFRRCLVFSSRHADRNQSCMDVRFPELIVFPYVKMVFAGLLVNPKPERFLIVGQGGGTIPAAFEKLYPSASIDVVEIDAAVDRMARQYFGYKEGPNTTITINDARVYVRRAALQGKRYDMIVLDAFTGDYIPEHLMTVEFLAETAALLTAKGVLVANTFSSSRLYDHESQTYVKAFGSFFNFRMQGTLNRVIIATQHGYPDREILQARADALQPKVLAMGVEISRYVKHLTLEADWDTTRRALTDQYSPANLLQDSR
tara:strand:- start:23 stop:961 length:939 start_codon:yes stop_codon:yes gene_type:complete